MLNIKLGKAQYSVYFGYEATVRSGIIKKLVGATRDTEDQYENIDKMMNLVPEMLLVGLQKFHAKEYGYNLKTEEGKDEALSKVFSLLDEYFETEDADFENLLTSLQTELMENGFLAKMFKKEVEKAENQEKEEKK